MYFFSSLRRGVPPAAAHYAARAQAARGLLAQ